MEEQSTLPATQPVLRKEGFNSMLSEQDESDVICILLPTSPAAHEAVELTAQAAPQHILQNRDMPHLYEAPDEDMIIEQPADDADDLEDLNTQPRDPNQPKWDGPTKDIALRFSSKVHNLGLGFTFGRNPTKCDLLLSNNDTNMISNRHFRIFMKGNGSLMIEDTSTNGTMIDSTYLRAIKPVRVGPNPGSQHTLCGGSTIEIPLEGKQRGQSIRFSVKIPERGEVGLEKYTQTCIEYVKLVEQAERQHGFVAEATKNGNAPVVPPVSYRAAILLSLPPFLTHGRCPCTPSPRGLGQVLPPKEILCWLQRLLVILPACTGTVALTTMSLVALAREPLHMYSNCLQREMA